MEQKNIQELKEKTTVGQKKRVKWIFSRRNIFVWLFLVIKNLFSGEGDLLHALGSHIITGYPGAGKTLLMNHIKNSVDHDKYFFISNIPEFEEVGTFKLTDVFDENMQIKSFPIKDELGRSLYGIIFDEVNLSFNKRLNMRKDYNEIFIGLIEFLVTHRHQGIPRVYFIGQKLELQDTQLQSLFKYQHDIVKKRVWPKYKPYNLSGKLIYYPIKLKIINRIKAIDETREEQFIDVNKKKIKISQNDLESYNTRALGEAYAKLPKAEIS